jgi:hypothetical protein
MCFVAGLPPIAKRAQIAGPAAIARDAADRV